MGMRESLIVNFEDLTLEYQDKKFYILKQFDYKGTTYLYGIDVDAFYKDRENLEFAFLYRMHDDIFNHVSDENLLDELFNYVSGLCMGDVIKKIAEKNNTNL